MFDGDNEQDDFLSEGDSDFSQQDNGSSADFFNNEENQSVQKDSHSGLCYKTVGVVVAVILAVLALVVIGLNNIHLVKKTSTSQYQTQQQIQQEQQKTEVTTEKSTTSESTRGTAEVNNTSKSTTTINSSGTTLTDIPSSTHIDYSSKVISSQGVVQKLSRYLQDGQVIYCIDLDITIGTTSTSVKYYCGYNIYKQVSVGDILTVDYQQVSDTCFSVCTISK